MADPWAVDPILDGPTLVTTPPVGPHPAGEVDAAAAVEAATALHESGFDSALHTALGELRRIAVEPVPVHAGADAAASMPPEGPAWPPTEPASASERVGGDPAAWLASLGEWWTARWRDLLPGIVVATLVVIAFAVVLASGTKHANTSHVDTRPSLSSDPSTTIAGLFATSASPNGDAVAPGSSVPAAAKAGSSAAPVTTKATGHTTASTAAPKASKPPSGAPTPTAPQPTKPSPTTAPATTAPATTAPTTTVPPQTTTVPSA